VAKFAGLALLIAAGCGRFYFDDRHTDAARPTDAALDTGHAIPTAGCVLHYEMDEASWAGGVIDSCGAHTGTAQNGASIVDDPTRGRVGSFVGGTSCVTTPDAVDLHMAGGLTISAWIHSTSIPPGNPDSYGVVAKRVSFDQAAEYDMWIDTMDHITVDIDTENDRAADPSSDYVNRWRQITLVYDGTLAAGLRTTWFVDGVQDFASSETSSTITPGVPEPDLWVGCLPLDGTAAQSMVGFIDEVVIWNRALTGSEVATWYTDTVK